VLETLAGISLYDGVTIFDAVESHQLQGDCCGLAAHVLGQPVGEEKLAIVLADPHAVAVLESRETVRKLSLLERGIGPEADRMTYHLN
jgi:hypothetical protein